MKNYTVIFSPLALEDIEQAVDYYEEKQTGLGKPFAKQVQLILNTIKRKPHFATTRYDDILCARIKNFRTWFTIILMRKSY